MISVKKIKQKDKPKYCSHCNKEADFQIMIENPKVIQNSSDALCKVCLGLLGLQIEKNIGVTVEFKNEEIFQAKLRLYNLLLKKDTKKLTDAEIKVMYELSKDHQIQDFLESKLELYKRVYKKNGKN